MENSTEGMPLSEVFNWDRLLSEKITNVFQFRSIKAAPFVYIIRKFRGSQEFELSRLRSEGENLVRAPWVLNVAEVQYNKARVGRAITQFTCIPQPRHLNLISEMRIKFDFYWLRFAAGKFYLPVTMSYLIDARSYMAILDQLMEERKQFVPEPVTFRYIRAH